MFAERKRKLQELYDFSVSNNHAVFYEGKRLILHGGYNGQNELEILASRNPTREEMDADQYRNVTEWSVSFSFDKVINADKSGIGEGVEFEELDKAIDHLYNEMCKIKQRIEEDSNRAKSFLGYR